MRKLPPALIVVPLASPLRSPMNALTLGAKPAPPCEPWSPKNPPDEPDDDTDETPSRELSTSRQQRPSALSNRWFSCSRRGRRRGRSPKIADRSTGSARARG
jgi:hypothetical protein